jgi:hypothetical protein
MRHAAKTVPDSITITRREDGAYDMVALFAAPGFPCDGGTNVGKMTMILEDASFDVCVEYAPGRSIDLCGLTRHVPPRVASYHLTLQSPMKPGVGGEESIFMRQEIVRAEPEVCCEGA